MQASFSHRSEQAVAHAREEALRLNSSEITPNHLLLGILKTESTTRDIFHHLKINVDALVILIADAARSTQHTTNDPPLSKSTETILKIVYLEAKLLKQNIIEPYHLLLAILREPNNSVRQEFEQRGWSERIKDEIAARVEAGRLRERRWWMWW